MILRSPTGATTPGGAVVVAKENVGDGFLHGVELSLDWNFVESRTASSSFSFTDGKVDTFVQGARKEEKPTSRIPPAQALLGLRSESRAAERARGADDRKLC